ncbi:unnamed protein product [Ilex paraguariensis]|uniref:Alliinase EGF-like domain-containing protein n=1 Tax=Ilex paraguariensis TaxID=185542 RepID=A0ABC8SA99_9AQUA
MILLWSESSSCGPYLVASIILNILFSTNLYVGVKWKELSWSQKASAKAEAAAALSCSGHGRAYLDGCLLMEKLFVSTIHASKALIALLSHLIVLRMQTGYISVCVCLCA